MRTGNGHHRLRGIRHRAYPARRACACPSRGASSSSCAARSPCRSAGIPARRLRCIRAPRCGRDNTGDRRRRARLVMRIDAQARRRPPDPALRRTSLAAGCVACADPHPRRRGLRAGPGRGQRKAPAKTTNIAAVLIRIITPTMNLLPAATSPIAAPRSTAGVESGFRFAIENPREIPQNACAAAEPALNRRNVENRESTLAGRDGSHGA